MTHDDAVIEAGVALEIWRERWDQAWRRVPLGWRVRRWSRRMVVLARRRTRRR